MTSNGDKYKPMQVRPEDHKKFVELCKKLGIHQTDGFKLSMEAWQDVISPK